MTNTEARKAFGLVKSYVESSNPRLRVSICRSGGGDDAFRGAVRMRRPDGTAFSLSNCVYTDTIYYRSEADFVRMLLGCETKLSKRFRCEHSSVGLNPIAHSVEELRLRHEVRFGAFPRNAV